MSVEQVLEQLNPYTLKELGHENHICQKILSGKFTVLEDFDISIFVCIFPEFKNTLTTDNTRYTFLFQFYKQLALKTFDYETYGELQLYCVALYVAHHLEVAINRTKNLGNNANLDTANLSATVNRNIGAKEVKNAYANFSNEYAQTSYGRELYPFMKLTSTIRLKGVY